MGSVGKDSDSGWVAWKYVARVLRAMRSLLSLHWNLSENGRRIFTRATTQKDNLSPDHRARERDGGDRHLGDCRFSHLYSCRGVSRVGALGFDLHGHMAPVHR